MINQGELDKVIQELRECGGLLMSVSDELATIFSGADEKQDAADPVGKKKKQAEKKEYTLEEVRKLLIEKSRAGFTAEVKKILTAHGAEKLSLLDKGEYAAVVGEAEKLG